MAIKGSLSEATLPDVIQLLSYSQKAGCLSVTDGRNFGNIFIKNGKIIFATLLNRKDRIGDILVAKQKITTGDLEKALELQKDRKKRIGEVLVEAGTITTATLDEELKEQIIETIFTMLTWDTGYFNFEADLLPGEEEFTVELSPQGVLLEGARRIDEWRKIENKLPPFETVLVSKGDCGAVPLTEQEQKIIQLINGARNIDEILKLSEYDFFETCRTIYGLISAGLLEKPEKPLTAQKTTGDVAEFKNLGFAFFKTEMYDEADREFNKILEIDAGNAEALLYRGLIEARRVNYDQARDLLEKAALIDKRPSILNNLGYVYCKLARYDEAIAHLSAAKDMAAASNKINCNLGIAYFGKGDYAQAEQVFMHVLEKAPELITPYVYLSLTRAKQNDMQKAAMLLREAIDKFPRAAAFKNNLAVFLEAMDKPEEAEKLYRQALEENPDAVQLVRNLADFYYEAQILGAARELYERIPADKRDWDALFKMGNIALRQGDGDSALSLWEQAQRLNPHQPLLQKNIEILKKSRETAGGD
jgi:tetratricopeptide (TPR) repeat protein